MLRMDEEKHTINTFHRLGKMQKQGEGDYLFPNNLMEQKKFFVFWLSLMRLLLVRKRLYWMIIVVEFSVIH